MAYMYSGINCSHSDMSVRRVSAGFGAYKKSRCDIRKIPTQVTTIRVRARSLETHTGTEMYMCLLPLERPVLELPQASQPHVALVDTGTCYHYISLSLVSRIWGLWWKRVSAWT